MYGLGADIPVGPARTPAPTTKIDRTQILDPREYYRDPLACPDWPVVGPNQGYDGQRGRAGAEARLQAIGLYLNRGEGALRAPTDDEREQVFAATFRRSGSVWYYMGINNLSPLGMMVESDAQLMAEACHLRGYLRKLDVQEKAAAEDAEARRKNEARRTLDEYRRTVADQIAEIESLNEAVARHKQAMEDEAAVPRQYGLRQRLDANYRAAVNAAHTLGLGVPDAPAGI